MYPPGTRFTDRSSGGKQKDDPRNPFIFIKERPKLLQIVLVGQPELRDLLGRPELRQLRQRIVLRHHLRPFDADETRCYVDERLRLAGYAGKGIFRRSAYRELYAVTGGVPRLVNIVCDGALLQGFARQLGRIRAEEICEVAKELELPAKASRAAEEPMG